MSSFNRDTIAAISTPPGEGGIGIIRVCGQDAFRILMRVFRSKKNINENKIISHHLYYGDIIDPDSGKVLDEVLVAFMKRPHSYTGDDTVEISCHGGNLVLRSVLGILLKNGARPAEPGEFTKRAFLNGRLDLTQAEAVVDVIRAKTDFSLDMARDQLKGRLSKEVNAIKDVLLNLLAHIEAELDFPEDDVGKLSDKAIREGLKVSLDRAYKLLSTYEEGRILREGLKAIILGRPNVGKSSLLNVLLKEERAIVTPIPGTTRDIIEEAVNIEGIPVRLIDTAGLRDTEDEVEAIGVRFARERLKDAHLVFYVVDASDEIEAAGDLLKGLKDKRVILVINKIDLVDEKRLKRLKDSYRGIKKAFISALCEQGIDQLKGLIYEVAIGHSKDFEEGAMITQLRHKTALEEARSAIKNAERALTGHLPREFIAMDLREAVERLGKITGEVTTDEVLDMIFSQFCIGK